MWKQNKNKKSKNLEEKEEEEKEEEEEDEEGKRSIKVNPLYPAFFQAQSSKFVTSSTSEWQQQFTLNTYDH